MKQTFRRRVALSVFALAALLCSLPGLAQQTLGSLNGTVVDSSGAAISGATVTATDADINVTSKATTSAVGYFQIFNLPVGTYTVTVTRDGFEVTKLEKIPIQEARATSVNPTLKVGQASESVVVTGTPLLNATDATNGYTLDAAQIQLTPLATGSFTQLAVLSPGVNAELLSGLDSNAGLGNQPIWANGQRDTSNTFQVNGVDVTNLFNGKSSSGDTSQRYNFNIGGGSTSASSTAGGATTGGANPTGTSVYGSNGNSLPSPAPEFTQEIRVNTSMYDAQQGATSGAQIDVNTKSGTDTYHGQVYGSFANNALNADPFFFKQEYLLGTVGVGYFPQQLENPYLQRYTSGGTIGGPIPKSKNKLFFFLGYEHMGLNDQSTGLSQMTVPTGLSDDRSSAGLIAAATSWNGGTPVSGLGTSKPLSQIAEALLQAPSPNGGFLIPSNQTPTQPYQYGVPNVTLLGNSTMSGDFATAALDYVVTDRDRLSFKYYYQNDPVSKQYAFSQTAGFPVTQENAAQVGALDNTIQIGSRFNWEQRLGYARMYSYSYFVQTLVPDPTLGPTYGIGTSATDGNAGNYTVPLLPGLTLDEFATNSSSSPALKVGPDSAFANTGYYQNRLNPSTNVIFTLGKHTIVAGGGYSYTQLNVSNNRNNIPLIATKTFATFLEGAVKSSSEILSDAGGHNDADRYYRSNEIEGYLQDKWQVKPNLSITAGVRYDYHGGLTEKYGNIFTFDPNVYNVTGTDGPAGFTVLDAGFIAAPNNKYLNGVPSADIAGSDSTLTGRQWGISPRLGFAWSPLMNHNKVVFSGGAGIYYDRGELFSYLSQPAGGAASGPFGVTESAPLVTDVTGTGTTLSDPLGAAGSASAAPNFAASKALLQSTLNGMTEVQHGGAFGANCSGLDSQANYTDCASTLYFGTYNKDNVLPYTINYTLNMQWQPREDLAITIGYTGNRGRHAVVPIPFNEPQIATSSNPAMVLGASPHASGETSSYGFEVLNQNKSGDEYGDYAPIAGEPWNTESGGNTDFRAPYVGYNPNAASFKTAGNSAYDALQTHLEKRLSHNFQVGASYTWSHTLDEQSDIGLFFTGDNPANLRQSYGSSDFDRTNVFTANFQAILPNFAKAHSLLSYLTNGWNATGIGVLQSGEPYSLYEFYGAVGSINFGDYPLLMNPVLPIKDPGAVKKAMTGNKGSFRGSGGSYIPTIDPNQIAINYLQPGQDGIPVSTGSDPQDIYETNFAPGNQRNIFRQSGQKRLDMSFRKNFQVTNRFGLEYAFNVFNVFNTTSLDIPQDSVRIRQNDSCSNSAYNNPNGNCANDYLNYGQIATSNSPTDQQSALHNLDQLPVTNGTGRNLTVPLNLTNGQGTCTSSTCPNNGANFGSVTSTIGGSRAITMAVHVTF
jgi:Carboxypeptidase regulatory-like domain